MSITTTMAARDGRRAFRKLVVAFLGGGCPCCRHTIEAHDDGETDACMRTVSYWNPATFVALAPIAQPAKRAPRRKAA